MQCSCKQKGMALIVTLVMILVLALLAVGTSRDNALEQRMSFNAQQYNSAYQQAESIFSRVEAMVVAEDIGEDDIGDAGVYAMAGENDSLPDSFNVSDFSAWDDKNSVAVMDEVGADGINQRQRVGRFIIEDNGLTGKPCLNANNCKNASTPRERVWGVAVLGESDDDSTASAYAHIILVGNVMVAE